jgi:uncharacterized membrane protein YedE/YeeE
MWQPSFTPALVGGLLIGASASVLLVTIGRVAGWSGVVAGLVRPRAGEVAWRALLLVGLLIGGVVAGRAWPGSFPAQAAPWPLLAVAGLLVGYGTKLGGGCTSGHGVCGISRGSVRSIVATVTFMLTGVIAVFVLRRVMGGLP